MLPFLCPAAGALEHFNEYSQRIARPVFARRLEQEEVLLFDKRDIKRDVFRQETQERRLEVKSLASKTPKVVWKVIDFTL